MKFDLQLVDRRARSVRTIRPLFNRLGLLWTIELPETGVEVELDLNGSERIMDGNVSRASERRLRGSNAGAHSPKREWLVTALLARCPTSLRRSLD
jgi:hypothetical protein